MNIFSVGQLIVFVEEEDSGQQVRTFIREQDHGLDWNLGQVSLSDFDVERKLVRLIFHVRSQAFGNEVSLDDIMLETVPCDFGCKFNRYFQMIEPILNL